MKRVSFDIPSHVDISPKNLGYPDEQIHKVRNTVLEKIVESQPREESQALLEKRTTVLLGDSLSIEEEPLPKGGWHVFCCCFTWIVSRHGCVGDACGKEFNKKW